METEKRCVIFENSGQKIFGVVHIPSGASEESPCPAVLICHGYGGNKCGKHRLYVRLANRLARIGIAVLRFDFRGSGDSDGEFQQVNIDTEVSDFYSALNYLKNLPFVDPARIGILGNSLGGAIAVTGASSVLKGLRALVLWAPPLTGEQWQKQWQHKANTVIDGEFIEFQGQQAHLTLIKQLFALDLKPHLTKLKRIPLLHFYGEKDNIIDKTHREGYQKVRTKSIAPSQFIILKKSDHDFTDFAEQQKMLKGSEEWFQKYLFGDDG